MVEDGVIKPDMKGADIQNWLKARRPWACAARPTIVVPPHYTIAYPLLGAQATYAAVVF
jgi:hypothetical protein